MKLNELVKIESGINSVRVKDQNYTLYTIEDVNYDLGHGEDYQHDKASGKSITARGDIVINTVNFSSFKYPWWEYIRPLVFMLSIK